MSAFHLRKVACVIPNMTSGVTIYCERSATDSGSYHKEERTFCQVFAESPGNYFFAVCGVVYEMFVALHPNIIFIFGCCGPH